MNQTTRVKTTKKRGVFWHSWESGWSRAILLVCQWKANIQRSDFTDNRVHGSARPPVGVRGMYQSKWRTTKSVPCKLLKPPCCKKWLLLFCSSGFENGSISKYTLTLADMFGPDESWWKSTLSSLINDPYGITDPKVSFAPKNKGPIGNKRPSGTPFKK